MNNIKVKVVEADKYILINYLIKNNIYFKYVKEINHKQIILIDIKDLKTIKKKYKVVVINYYGFKRAKKFINKNFIFLLSFLWGIVLLYLLSTTIFEVNINTTNKKLKEKIFAELDKYDIKKYGRIKSYKSIINIKNDIVKNNNDSIEWIEIKREGVKYEVLLTERVIIEKEVVDTTPRHIVASKDALIKQIISSKGDIVKEVNDYVKKGEILISGNIYKYDKLVNSVDARGRVFGEVWYLVKTTIPYKYTEYVRTGEVINHYYVEIFGYPMTLIGKYDAKYTMNSKKVLINKPYLGLKLVKEKKELYEYKEFKVSKDEALNEANKRSDKGINNKLKENEYIINKKVLNIYPKDSKMEVEIFYKVYEDITDTLLIEETLKEGE